MKKEIRVPKGKSDERFVLLTESKYTNVIIGGQLTLSVEDARGLYNLTTAKPDEEERIQQGFQCVRMLRDLSKRILFTTGDATSPEDLVDVFKTPEPKVVDPFDQPLTKRVSDVG